MTEREIKFLDEWDKKDREDREKEARKEELKKAGKSPEVKALMKKCRAK